MVDGNSKWMIPPALLFAAGVGSVVGTTCVPALDRAIIVAPLLWLAAFITFLVGLARCRRFVAFAICQVGVALVLLSMTRRVELRAETDADPSALLFFRGHRPRWRRHRLRVHHYPARSHTGPKVGLAWSPVCARSDGRGGDGGCPDRFLVGLVSLYERGKSSGRSGREWRDDCGLGLGRDRLALFRCAFGVRAFETP